MFKFVELINHRFFHLGYNKNSIFRWHHNYVSSTKPKTIAELKESLQVIWSNLPQGPIDKAVKNLSN